MAEPTINVYEAFERVHQIIEHSGVESPEDATPLDRAEYRLQINKLVEGLVELLHHAAEHGLLTLDAGEAEYNLTTHDIGVYNVGGEEPAAKRNVAIRVPSHFIAGRSLDDAVGSLAAVTVETTADLFVAENAWRRLVTNEDERMEAILLEAWHLSVERIIARVTPSVQRMDAAGLFRVYDARTDDLYLPSAIVPGEDGVTMHVVITSNEPPKPRAPRKKTPARATAAKKPRAKKSR